MPPEAPEDRQWVTVASLIGPRGNRGEIQAVPLSSRSDRFQRLKEVFLFDVAGAGEPPVQVGIESVWQHREKVIFKFRGVDTISQAERLRGREVRIPLEERLALPEGEYYESDLIGFDVAERAGGRPLGRVKGWQHCGGPPLLEVEDSGGAEWLVPFAASICVEIDLEKRRILVELPEGLQDLNR